MLNVGKEKQTSIRLTELQYKRIALLGGERQWSMARVIGNILDEYFKKIFKENSTEFKE